MPPMRIATVYWGLNVAYATRRATITEIEEVLFDYRAFRRNLRGRVGTHMATGRTRAGRRIAVAFLYRSATRTAVAISAWEVFR